MKKNRVRNEKGQSTVEFALTMMFLMAFILFFFQLGLVLAYGNYVHYATFMSARAYFAAGGDQKDQKDRANDVLKATLKGGSGNGERLPFVAKGVGGSEEVTGADVGSGPEYVDGGRDSSWEQGVRYTFRSRLFLLPLSGTSASANGNGSSGNSITLTSESWLGREPADDDCQAQLGKSQKGWIYDNGC